MHKVTDDFEDARSHLKELESGFLLLRIASGQQPANI